MGTPLFKGESDFQKFVKGDGEFFLKTGDGIKGGLRKKGMEISGCFDDTKQTFFACEGPLTQKS